MGLHTVTDTPLLQPPPPAYALPTDVLVGGIACRFEKTGSGAVRVYIMTLGVLAPYRGRGVGKRLLVRALSEAQKEAAGPDEVYLHVQTSNAEAIAFYKHFGFEVRPTPRLAPAWP